jgi:hypothetical protein
MASFGHKNAIILKKSMATRHANASLELIDLFLAVAS